MSVDATQIAAAQQEMKSAQCGGMQLNAMAESIDELVGIMVQRPGLLYLTLHSIKAGTLSETVAPGASVRDSLLCTHIVTKNEHLPR